ncbi:MAG: hypothetical protein RIR26_368 [Pseudomonadota bacterium]|jgi:uncharacterized protein (DUF2141 family)
MTTIRFSLALAALSGWVVSCGQNNSSQLLSRPLESVEFISVVVKDLRFDAGNPNRRPTSVCYAVFAGPEGFPSNPDKVVLKDCKPVDSSIVSFLIEGLPPSSDGYVVSLFQDMNLNGKLDTRSLFGIQVPDEPFGFTQNPPLLGAPTYDKCKIVPQKNGEKFEIVMKKIGG